jgi:ribose transport system substrate-binding protein
VEACKCVKGLLPDGGTVAILTGVLGAPNLEERIDGFEEEAAGSNIKVLTIVSGNDDVQTSVEVVNQYTAGNPDLDAWWFDGGWPFFADPDALSELKTWREAGGKIVSIDTFYPMLQFVDLGMVDQLIGSDYIAMGSQGVQMLFDAINGQAVTEEYVDTGLEMCTKDNVDEVRSTKNEW